MILRIAAFSAIVIGLFLICGDFTCLADQAETQVEEYVHHEYIYGTARVDYIEKIDAGGMVTYYYKYNDPRNLFRVTGVEVFKGSKYYAAADTHCPT